jgi:hypothetical protein
MQGDVGQVGLVTGSLKGKLRHSSFHIGGTEGLAPPRCSPTAASPSQAAAVFPAFIP